MVLSCKCLCRGVHCHNPVLCYGLICLCEPNLYQLEVVVALTVLTFEERYLTIGPHVFDIARAEHFFLFSFTIRCQVAVFFL